jgi:hypothetical protein
MLGHDHALTGAVAFVAVAPLLPVTGPGLLAGLVLTAALLFLAWRDSGLAPVTHYLDNLIR